MQIQKTALANVMKSLLLQLEVRLALSKALDLYLAGGMAVNLYTAGRVTSDSEMRLHWREMSRQQALTRQRSNPVT